MNYVQLTKKLYSALSQRFPSDTDGFDYYSRSTPWYGVRKNEKSHQVLFGIYADGMKLNIRLKSKEISDHNKAITKLQNAGLSAQTDPNGAYWLLVPICQADLEDSVKLNAILECMNSRYQELKDKN